jgi:phage terminase small subunit
MPPKDPNELTYLEKRFVEEMLIDPSSQAKAAARAGYALESAKVAGCRVATRPRVQQAIEEGRKERAERLGFTQDRVLVELAKIAFADLKEAIKEDEQGNVINSPLVEISHEVTTDKLGNKTKHIKAKTPKVADKTQALIQLGKHLGLFEEKVEVTGQVSLLDLVTKSFEEDKD